MPLRVLSLIPAGLLLLVGTARAVSPGATLPGFPPPTSPIVLREGSEPPVGQSEPPVDVQLPTTVQSGFLVLYEPGTTDPHDPARWSDVVVYRLPTRGTNCTAGDPATIASLVSDGPGESGITDADLAPVGASIAMILGCGAFTVYQQEGTSANGLNVYTADPATIYDVYSDAEGVPPINPTHYWTYHVLDAPPLPTPISVKDQFWGKYIPVTVDSLQRLFNWVEKDGSAVEDSMVHFTWWNIVEKRPFQAFATISNQFGTGRVFISNVAFLMAPAWKNTDLPGIPAASHYLCYRASGFLPQPITHDFKDEWRIDGQIADSLVYFCAPCSKIHGTQVYAPTDEVTHLALYRLHPQSPVFGPIIKDQFIARTFPVTQIGEEYLAVPSSKSEVVGVIPETPRSGVTMDAPRPNPAQTEASFSFSLPRDMEVLLEVFDIGGRRVATLARGVLPPGEHPVVWDLRDAAGKHVRAGIYVMRLVAGRQQLKRLLVVTR